MEIPSIEENENEILVSVNRIGKMPMPIEIEVLYEDSSKKIFYIPLSIMRGDKTHDSSKLEYKLLDDWEWVNNTYESIIYIYILYIPGRYHLENICPPSTSTRILLFGV